MGEGWVGVRVVTGSALVSNLTPPQPLPIEGRGFKVAAHIGARRALFKSRPLC